MSLEILPVELLSNVFQNADKHDIPRLRTVCRRFNGVIKRHYIFLPRVAYVVKIYMDNGEIFITHKKSGNWSGSTKVREFKQHYHFFDFDFEHWKDIEIVELEISGLQTSANSLKALETVIGTFFKTKQAGLRKFAMRSVELDESHTDSFLTILQIGFQSCESITVEDSFLPVTINKEMIESSTFDHFIWSNSTSNIALNTDRILQKLQNDMRKTSTKRNFLADMESVPVESVCNFIEEWLRLPVASFFNLSFHNCDMTWKMRFMAECERRKLGQNYLEFQSKVHANAHVKVSFSQDATTCCLWPILDVPARTTGQSVCYARYFRDF